MKTDSAFVAPQDCAGEERINRATRGERVLGATNHKSRTTKIYDTIHVMQPKVSKSSSLEPRRKYRL